MLIIIANGYLIFYLKWKKDLAIKNYDAFQARYPGRLSELLFDVWMNKNGLNYKEVPFMYTVKN